MLHRPVAFGLIADHGLHSRVVRRLGHLHILWRDANLRRILRADLGLI